MQKLSVCAIMEGGDVRRVEEALLHVRLQSAPSRSRPRANGRNELPLRGGLLVLYANSSNPSYPFHATAYTKSPFAAASGEQVRGELGSVSGVCVRLQASPHALSPAHKRALSLTRAGSYDVARDFSHPAASTDTKHADTKA